MSKAVLCIGSNVGMALVNIRHAVSELTALGCRVVETSPLYQVALPYINLVVVVDVRCTFDALVRITKEVERRFGRTKQMKAYSIVPIDIDVVMYDGEVMRPIDYSAPYFQKGYRTLKCTQCPPKVY